MLKADFSLEYNPNLNSFNFQEHGNQDNYSCSDEYGCYPAKVLNYCLTDNSLSLNFTGYDKRGEFNGNCTLDRAGFIGTGKGTLSYKNEATVNAVVSISLSLNKSVIALNGIWKDEKDNVSYSLKASIDLEQDRYLTPLMATGLDKKRTIALSIETTGFEISANHRVIEIGCAEIINKRITGNYWHAYIGTQQPIDVAAFPEHGINAEFLEDKPSMGKIINEFLSFINDAELVVHNAPFEIGFLNNELAFLKRSIRLEDHCSIINILELARREISDERYDLDSIAERCSISHSKRKQLLTLQDSLLLAEVFLVLSSS